MYSHSREELVKKAEAEKAALVAGGPSASSGEPDVKKPKTESSAGNYTTLFFK